MPSASARQASGQDGQTWENHLCLSPNFLMRAIVQREIYGDSRAQIDDTFAGAIVAELSRQEQSNMRKCVIFTVLLLAVSVRPSSATPLDISSISGEWINPVGGLNLTGVGTSTMTWGDGVFP